MDQSAVMLRFTYDYASIAREDQGIEVSYLGDDTYQNTFFSCKNEVRLCYDYGATWEELRKLEDILIWCAYARPLIQVRLSCSLERRYKTRNSLVDVYVRGKKDDDGRCSL